MKANNKSKKDNVNSNEIGKIVGKHKQIAVECGRNGATADIKRWRIFIANKLAKAHICLGICMYTMAVWLTNSSEIHFLAKTKFTYLHTYIQVWYT